MVVPWRVFQSCSTSTLRLNRRFGLLQGVPVRGVEVAELTEEGAFGGDFVGD